MNMINCLKFIEKTEPQTSTPIKLMNVYKHESISPAQSMDTVYQNSQKGTRYFENKKHIKI